MVRLVVGLGNPGRKYAKTRHNAGFRVVDRLAERWGVPASRRQFEAEVSFKGAGDDRVGLVKPLTYMNESGRAVRALLGYYKVEPQGVLVVCDDLALPLGKLRLRRGGSDGGQKGVRSIAQHLGTTDVPRLRLGIGAAPEPMDAADYVLSRFSSEEEEAFQAALEEAARCVELWIEEGVEAAMNRFNAGPEAGRSATDGGGEAPSPGRASPGSVREAQAP